MRKNGNRVIVALVLCLLMAFGTATAYAAPSIGDLFRFLPTVITVEKDSVEVEGYFVNLSNKAISNLTDFSMDVYTDGDLIVQGDFGTINKFTVPSMGTKFQTFTINGSHELNTGVYDCDDSYYTSFGCNFSVR